MSIFKAYDVRGLYGTELDETLARKIGAAFVQVTSAKSLVVGRDMRESAPAIADAFIDGAARSGATVTRIGLASTPMAYFAIGHLGVDGGAQVTASHNAGPYIGFKFCRKGCVPMSGDTGIKDIERLVLGGSRCPPRRRRRSRTSILLEAYAEHVLKFGPGIKKLRVVIDAGNGMGGYTAPAILKRLPIEAECPLLRPRRAIPESRGESDQGGEHPEVGGARPARRRPTSASRSTVMPTAACSSTRPVRPVRRMP